MRSRRCSGAVYIDGGYEKAREVIIRLLKEKIDKIIVSGEFHDFKTDLQEKTQLAFRHYTGIYNN